MTILAICALTSFSNKSETVESQNTPINSVASEKIKVLNFATFHMGGTSDANSVEFDEKDKKNKKETQKIAQLIAAFQPTIICVEVPLEDQSKLNSEYQKYLSNPLEGTSYSGEVRLIAFEVGRLSNVPKIYGMDHKMDYNYNIASEITNFIDSNTLHAFYANPFKFYPELNVNESELSLLERLRIGNTASCLDFLIMVNADLLTFVGTENGYEGADEAAKYYHRNL